MLLLSDQMKPILLWHTCASVYSNAAHLTRLVELLVYFSVFEVHLRSLSEQKHPSFFFIHVDIVCRWIREA